MSEELTQRREEATRRAAAQLHTLIVRFNPALKSLAQAFGAMAVSTAEVGRAMSAATAELREVLLFDAHSSNGDDLRRLDAVLEEHRLRIRGLGGKS